VLNVILAPYCTTWQHLISDINIQCILVSKVSWRVLQQLPSLLVCVVRPRDCPCAV